jgi:hypothetical protein
MDGGSVGHEALMKTFSNFAGRGLATVRKVVWSLLGNFFIPA